MAELKLKSETAKSIKATPHMVRMHEDVQFFGINGKQVADGMSGVRLEWCPDIAGGVVVVTCDAFPGQSKWLFPSGIQHISWKTDG